MGHPTLEYIRGLRKTLETKKAEIVGENPANIPGSEHDGKPDAKASKPDQEVKDQTMVPNSGLTTAGAGDDSKITHTNDLQADEAALTPTKKPEVTGDAEASVPGGKTAEALAAEILAGVNGWYEARKQAEAAEAAKAADTGSENQAAKTAADTQGPSAGAGTAEALITDKGKEPDQTKDVIPPAKKDEITDNAMVPATGEGASGETAAAAKAAEGAGDAGTAENKEAGCGGTTSKDKPKDAAEKCCADGKCGKCAKCKAAKCKCAGAVDMELTSDVLAKIAAVMLATEEGTKLAEDVLSKAAGAEAAEKTLTFLRTQNELVQKRADYQAGQRDALALILKQAQEACKGECKGDCKCEGGGAGDGACSCGSCGDAGAAAGDGATAVDDGGLTEIADTLDAMVESGEITEDEADQVVVELAQALSGGSGSAAPETTAGADAAASDAGKKEAQAVDPAAAAAGSAGADAGNAAIDATVAVPPGQLDPSSVPQGDLSDVTPEDVASAIDTLVQSGEITEDEADQLVGEITGGAGADAGAAGSGDVSPEEIATALQEAVANGDIKPEDVQKVLTELEGVPAPDAAAGTSPAGDAAGADAAAGTAAGAAPAAVTPTDEPKTAGAKLLAAIQAARTAKTAAATTAAAK